MDESLRLLQFFPVECGVKGLGYRTVSFLKLGYHLIVIVQCYRFNVWAYLDEFLTLMRQLNLYMPDVMTEI